MYKAILLLLMIAVAGSPEANAVLLAEKRDGMLEQFLLKRDDTERQFPDWRNSDNPTYAPSMTYEDINQDGKKELVIILTTGHGTGVLLRKVHVFHGEDEVLVEDPLAVVLKCVDTKLTPDQAELTIFGQRTVVDIAKWQISPENLFDDIGFGSIIRYEVIGNQLTATLAAQVSPAGFIGNVRITYEFKHKLYQAKTIEFITDPA